MFHFANPWCLLLLLLVPLLVARWRRLRRGALTYSNTGFFSGLPQGRGRRALVGGTWLRALGLTAIVIALAGPRLADWHTRVPTSGIAIGVVLDVSGSMAKPDFLWNDESISRLEAAKRSLRLFVEGGAGPDDVSLDGRPTDLVSLVTFATWPESVCPLTLSHPVLLSLLDEQQPRKVSGESSTNLSDALALALHRIEQAPVKRKVLVLISDGEHNVSDPQSEQTPRQIAQVAASLNVPIYAIDASGEHGDDENLEPGVESQQGGAEKRASAEVTLRNVAQITKGKYFRARDSQALVNVCKDIEQLEKNELHSFQYRRYYDGFPWFGAAAFALFGLVSMLEWTVWRRIP